VIEERVRLGRGEHGGKASIRRLLLFMIDDTRCYDMALVFMARRQRMRVVS
jgi:hypothetical protein